MSGMVGVFHRDKQTTDTATLAGMTATMAYRGPDGIHHWHQGSVGLGHCMLQTTPESLQETLPLSDTLAGLAITADARIDNRAELSSALGLDAATRRSISDSELILRAYQRWDRDCVDHLIGDFAFLIWDEKRQQLFGARDHMGIRPFLYHVSDRLFVAASEVRAIRAHPLVAHRFNEARIADFLVEPLEGVDRTSTFYQNISRLPPAHRITLSADSLSIDHYWQLDPGRELKLGSDAEYTEAFRALLDEAVRARMRCKGQVSCMVSGGVDSSTVAAVARDLLVNSGARPLRVYSGIADDESLSLESQSIRRVLASGGFDSVTIRPGEIGTYEASLRNLFEHLEEPFDNHMTLIQMVYLLGRKHGDRVMLDGVEGDQSHSLTPGYPAYLIRQGHLITAYREVLGLWNNFHYPGDRSVAALLRKSVRPAFVPNWLRRWRNRHLLDRLAAQPLQASCIKPDFADRARIAQRFHRFRNNVGIGLCDSLREQHIRSVEHPFMAVGKERYNRVASLCGIEPRHPLLDKRLVELSISLPWNQKVRHGRSKHLLRLTAEALLPREIAWRQSWENLGWEFTEQRMRLLGDTMRRKCVKMAPQLQRFIDDTLLERVLSSRSSDDQLEDNNLLWEIYSLASWLSRLNDPEH